MPFGRKPDTEAAAGPARPGGAGAGSASQRNERARGLSIESGEEHAVEMVEQKCCAPFVCFRPADSSVKSVKWSFVGQDQGGFESLDWNHAGQDRGSYKKLTKPSGGEQDEVQATGAGLGPRGCAAAGLLLVLGLTMMFLGVTIERPRDAHQAQALRSNTLVMRPAEAHAAEANATEAHAKTVHPLYDCSTGFLHWEKAWTRSQQAACCKAVGRGCGAGTSEVEAHGRVSGTMASRWVLAPEHASCTEACEKEGMTCSTRAFDQMNSQVDSNAEVGQLVTSLGASCTEYNTGFGTSPDVPNVLGAVCMVSSPTRNASTFSCESPPFPLELAKRRLCACSKEQDSSPEGPEQADASPQGRGCQKDCRLAGTTWTCKHRIEYATERLFAGEQDPCLSAHKHVLGECDCDACTAEEAGCQAAGTGA